MASLATAASILALTPMICTITKRHGSNRMGATLVVVGDTTLEQVLAQAPSAIRRLGAD